MSATNIIPTTEIDDDCAGCAELRERVAELRGLMSIAVQALELA